MEKDKKNVFITDDIHCESDIMRDEYDSGYGEMSFTENIDDFLQFVIDYSEKADANAKKR